MNGLLDHPDTVVPTEKDAELAAQASRALASEGVGTELKVRLDDGRELILPRAAARLLHHILTEMSQGNAVTIIPIHAELTTQQAADFLNVSRPYLVRLLKEGKIPFQMVGTHRRVKFAALERFRKDAEAMRQKAMDELAEESQKLGLGY